MPGLSSFLFGAPEGETTQIERFTQQQKAVLDQILQMALGGLQQDDQGFGPIEEHARTQFEQKTIPGIAERFTQMGGQPSGAFQRSLGEAGSGLESSLAALRSQYGLDQSEQFQRLASLGLAPQFESIYSPAGPGFLESAGTGLAGGAARALPTLLSGLVSRLGGGAGPGANMGAPVRAGAALAPALGALGGGGGALGPLSSLAPPVAGAAGTGAAATAPQGLLSSLGAIAPALGVMGAGAGFAKLLQFLVRRKGKRIFGRAGARRRRNQQR